MEEYTRLDYDYFPTARADKIDKLIPLYIIRSVWQNLGNKTSLPHCGIY